MAQYLRIYQVTHLKKNNNNLGDVFMCDVQKATDYEELERLGIKGALYLHETPRPNTVLEEFTSSGIHHYHLLIDDEGKNIKENFQRIVKIIDFFVSKGYNCLVYCNSGITLSPFAVIAYILYRYFIVNANKPKRGSPMSTLMMRKLQKINNDIDYSGMNNAIGDLVTYERELKSKRQKIDEIDSKPDPSLDEIMP